MTGVLIVFRLCQTGPTLPVFVRLLPSTAIIDFDLMHCLQCLTVW